jgi:uncharacterized protein (DUF302 family)
MTGINFKRELDDTLDNAIDRVTKALGAEGFGIMTRIDMHSKLKEKIGKDIVPTVILGACSPSLAYEAYTANSDVACVLPCNAVLREVAPGRISVELAAPSAMMRILGDEKLVALALPADERIRKALANA